MSATIVQTELGSPEFKQLGMRVATLGKLRYALPASGKPRDVYSADGDFRATIDGNPDQGLQGRCCITVHDGTAFGIVPANGTGTATYFSVPVSELSVETEGSQGMLKKRPTQVRLQADGFQLKLSDVDKLLLNMEKYQSGQENSLVSALRR